MARHDMAKIIMNLLRLYPDAAGDNFDWALLDNNGCLLQSGTNDMPQADTCEVILPAAQVLLTRARIPKTNKRRQAAMLPFAAEDQIISEPEANHVAQGGSFPDGTVALAITDRPRLARLLANLKSHNLAPKRALPEMLVPALTPQSWTLVWDGNSGFVRSGEFSGMALDGDGNNPPPGLKLALQAAPPPQKIVLRLAGGNVPDIELWSAQLGVAIEPGDHWDWRHATPACPLNLLQGEFGAKQMDLSWLPDLRPAAIMLALMAGLQFFGTVADWALLAHEKNRLDAQMTQLFRTSFPDANVVVDAPLQMDRKLADLKHAAGLPAPGDFLPLLSLVARPLAALPPGALKNIDYEPGKLGFGVALSAADDAGRLQNALAAPHLKVQMEKLAPDTGGGVTAYFTVSPENS